MTTATVIALLLVTAASAATWPMPKNWRAKHYPAWFAEAMCIHRYEGAWNANTGNGYYGGMQFLLSTWRRAGGSGYPHLWPPREQLYRARVIWRANGGSWREWGTAWRCT